MVTARWENSQIFGGINTSNEDEKGKILYYRITWIVRSYVIYVYPPNKYMLKVKNGNTRKKYKIQSKLTITPPEHVINFVLSLLLTLKIFYTFFNISIIDFEQVNICRVGSQITQASTNFEVRKLERNVKIIQSR